jgi:hypothetical protein
MKKNLLLVIPLVASFALLAVPKKKGLPRRTTDSLAKIIKQRSDWVRRKHDEQAQEHEAYSALLKKVPSVSNLRDLEGESGDLKPTPNSVELARLLSAAQAAKAQEWQGLTYDDLGFDDEDEPMSETIPSSAPVAPVVSQESPQISWTWWGANAATFGALNYFTQ